MDKSQVKGYERKTQRIIVIPSWDKHLRSTCKHNLNLRSSISINQLQDFIGFKEKPLVYKGFEIPQILT